MSQPVFKPLDSSFKPRKLTSLSKENMDKCNDIFRKSHNHIANMINNIKNKMESNKKNPKLYNESYAVEISRLKTIHSMVPHQEEFERIKDKFWVAREFIMNKDDKFFLERDYSDVIKRDENQHFLETIVECVCVSWKTLTDDEKLATWKILREILLLITEYKLIVAD